MPVYDILCLANSNKHGGRCVAGLRADGKGWIRLISHEPNGVLFDRHIALADSSLPRLLDLLRIRCAVPHPEPHHPEDCYITHSRWELLARPAPSSMLEQLRSALVSGPALFGNTQDRIPYLAIEANPLQESLALVSPENLKWRVLAGKQGDRQIKVSFTLKDAPYLLSLTDPLWKSRLAELAIGTHPRQAAGLEPEDPVLLTISLGEPFRANDYAERCCYKLAAAVIVPPLTWREAQQGVKPNSTASESEPVYDWSWLTSASSHLI